MVINWHTVLIIPLIIIFIVTLFLYTFSLQYLAIKRWGLRLIKSDYQKYIRTKGVSLKLKNVLTEKKELVKDIVGEDELDLLYTKSSELLQKRQAEIIKELTGFLAELSTLKETALQFPRWFWPTKSNRKLQKIEEEAQDLLEEIKEK